MTGTGQQGVSVDALAAQLGARREPGPTHELRLTVALHALTPAVRALHDAGARFVTIFLADVPEPALVVVCALGGRLIAIRAATGGTDPISYQSIGAWWPAARWAEQELCERDGTRPVGARFARGLIDPDADALDDRVRGLDVFAIPYGPVRSGVFEAMQFQIASGGESVPWLQTRPFFKHRGLELRFRGLAPERAVYVAERIAGIASVAYAVAFSQAVERALAVEPTPAAERWRVVHAELERLACHLDVIAKEAETTALYVGQARFQILKEQVMRLRAQLTGSRFGRGVIVPGGVRAAATIGLEQLRAALDALERQLVADRRLFLGTPSMIDRLIGAGRLSRDLIERYGAVGPLARGSGVSVDARHERPYGDYRRLGLRVVTYREGDAMARINVRFGELFESLRILRGAIDHLDRRDGQLRNPLPEAGSGAALGWAEAPQGELVVWVQVCRGLVDRVQIASPSLRNWALFHHAFGSDVLTDFAFIEHGFGLTPAGSRPLMLGWIARGLRQGRITTRYPRRDEPASHGYRGGVELLDVTGGSPELAGLCPTGAIAVDHRGQIGLDRGRCILCGECVQQAPRHFGFRSRYQTAERSREALIVSGDAASELPDSETLGQRAGALRRSIHVRHIDCGSDGGEEWEIQALWNPYYDIQRLGFFLTAAPRHADVLLVTGGVTAPMRAPLQRTWQVMPEPKALVAVGTDACSGGLAVDVGTVAGGVDRVLAVDVYVPGSPPAPIAIMHGLLLAVGLLAPDEVAS